MTAVTALTAQNTTGVYAIVETSPEFLARQIDVCVDDLGCDAVKIGMLSSVPIIDTVAAKIREHSLKNVVLDPVMVAKGGAPLLDPKAVDALKEILFPLATVVTPNLDEAGVLVGGEIATVAEMREAARAIRELGPKSVVVKGGHLDGPAIDVLFDGQDLHEFSAERLDTPHTHGTGCIFASAVATGLAQGRGVVASVATAKEVVTAAIGGGLSIGKGRGPADPLAWMRHRHG
jgi:hydroxymethylpyrimidine/phosphomethylpyrimidine kinase